MPIDTTVLAVTVSIRASVSTREWRCAWCSLQLGPWGNAAAVTAGGDTGCE